MADSREINTSPSQAHWLSFIWIAGGPFFVSASSKRSARLQWKVTGGFLMNTEQKEQIRKLRSSGHGYAAIANALGLTKNQVSAFCRRNNLTGQIADSGDENTPDGSYCRFCGKPIRQKPGRKEARFCCDACRLSWWNAHPEQVNRKAVYFFTCAGCGRRFTAYGNRHRKYCSHACYIADRFKSGDGHE
jgi:DNA-directed RNA polymerase subunit M/transcription elongation factor TFIIS